MSIKNVITNNGINSATFNGVAGPTGVVNPY